MRQNVNEQSVPSCFSSTDLVVRRWSSLHRGWDGPDLGWVLCTSRHWSEPRWHMTARCSTRWLSPRWLWSLQRLTNLTKKSRQWLNSGGVQHSTENETSFAVSWTLMLLKSLPLTGQRSGPAATWQLSGVPSMHQSGESSRTGSLSTMPVSMPFEWSDISGDSARRHFYTIVWQCRKWRTSENLNLGQTEDLQICAATLGGTLRYINENKFIHITLDENRKSKISIRERDSVLK